MNESKQLTEILDVEKIPYILMKIKVIKENDKTVKTIYADRNSYGWDKWNYNECMNYNNNGKPIEYKMTDGNILRIKKENCKNIQVNLNKSKYMIIDLDDKNTISHYLDKYEDSNKTLSSSKKLPHLWRLKNPNDKNINNKVGWQKGVDLIYKNVFETKDSKMFNVNIEEMKTFDDYPDIKSKKIITKKIKDNEDEGIILNNNYDNKFTDDEILKLLNKLPETYILDHDNWLKTATAMKSIGKVELFLNFCLNHPKTKCKTVGDIYYNKNIQNINGIKDHNEPLGVNMIGHLFKQLENPDKIENVDNSDFGLATLYLKVAGDCIVKHQGNIYVYHKPFWKVDKKKLYIKKDVRNILQSHLKNLRFKIQKLSLKNLAQDKEDKLSKNLENINQALASIGKVSKIDNIVKALDIELEEKDYKFDLINKNIFCFQDKAFNIYTGQEVEIKKYDYITQNTGYEYNEVQQEDIDFIDELIKKIMPNDNKRKTFISILKSALSGNQQPYFNLFNGDGCNGKGTIFEWLKVLMGEYYLNGNVDLLLTSFSSKGASENIAALDKKRLVVFSEPDETKKICADVMKVITDNPSIEARGLYEDLREVFFLGTYIMECNSRPAIKGRNDNALLRRVVDIEFETTFTNDEELLKLDNHYEKDTRFKETEFKEKYKIALFHYLIKEGDNKISICKEVQERSYEYLMDNDSLVEFFKDNCEVTSSKDDLLNLKDLYNLFKSGCYFNSLDKEQKRAWGYNHFTEKVKTNNHLKRFYRDRIVYNKKNYKRMLQCVKFKESLESDDED